MNIILVGAKGKMATVVKEIAEEFDTKICYEIDKNFTKPNNNQSKYFSEIPLEIIKQTDLVLDFSTPHVLKDELDFCVKAQLPLVICSTGHTKLDEDEILKCSKCIAIALIPNCSFGINIIAKIVKNITKYLNSFDIDIIEIHHKNKMDSPSGTAKLFIDILGNKNRTNVHSIRAGDVVGKHEIILTSKYEQITISHEAFNRKLFASGALNICRFFNKPRSPKLYHFDDIMFI